MKRLWIGVGLLVSLLALGLLVPELLDSCHEPVADALDRAAELAMDENWEAARRFFHRAEENWEEKRPVTASFTDHEPMDDIDGLFEQLEIYAAAENKVAFAGTCAYLSSHLEALGDYHDFSLWNLF